MSDRLAVYRCMMTGVPFLGAPLLTISKCEAGTSQASSEQSYSYHILASLAVKFEEVPVDLRVHLILSTLDSC